MRTKFTTHGDTGITVEYTDFISGLQECRTFAFTGSYVYELLSADTSRQVCKLLSSQGATLMANAKNFHTVIRAEFAKMMADSKKIANA